MCLRGAQRLRRSRRFFSASRSAIASSRIFFFAASFAACASTPARVATRVAKSGWPRGVLRRSAKRAIAGSAALLNETESSGETRNDESSDMSTVSIQRATNWSPVPHSASGQPPSTLSVRHMGSPFGPGLKLASSASSVGGFWHSPSALRPHALQRFGGCRTRGS